MKWMSNQGAHVTIETTLQKCFDASLFLASLEIFRHMNNADTCTALPDCYVNLLKSDAGSFALCVAECIPLPTSGGRKGLLYHKSAITGLMLSTDERELYSSSSDKFICAWRVSGAQTSSSLELQRRSFLCSHIVYVLWMGGVSNISCNDDIEGGTRWELEFKYPEEILLQFRKFGLPVSIGQETAAVVCSRGLTTELLSPASSMNKELLEILWVFWWRYLDRVSMHPT